MKGGSASLALEKGGDVSLWSWSETEELAPLEREGQDLTGRGWWNMSVVG